MLVINSQYRKPIPSLPIQSQTIEKKQSNANLHVIDLMVAKSTEI
jgi:hypothetical protein